MCFACCVRMRTRARVHFMKLYMCVVCVCACRPSGIQSRSEPQRLFASRTPSPTAIADVGGRRRKKERQQEREKTFSHCAYLRAPRGSPHLLTPRWCEKCLRALNADDMTFSSRTHVVVLRVPSKCVNQRFTAHAFWPCFFSFSLFLFCLSFIY